MEGFEAEALSAEVVFRGASDDGEPITAENVASRAPDPARARRVREWFERRGFTATNVHGVSLTVTGPRALFEETCGIGLSGPDERPGADVLELPPPPEMPGELAGDIEVITFGPPPDFGPGAY